MDADSELVEPATGIYLNHAAIKRDDNPANPLQAVAASTPFEAAWMKILPGKSTLSSIASRTESLERVAKHLLRLSMVIIFLWFGLQKFTLYEAIGIAPLVSNSPLTSWLNVLGTQGASMVFGTSELAIGLLLATGFRRPGGLAAALGALGSCLTFLTTLSFMATTPGVWAPSGPPLLSGTTGVFLIKDIVLLATSILLLAQALACRQSKAVSHRPARTATVAASAALC